MISSRKVSYLMVIVATALFVLAMAAPVMADRLVNLKGTFNQDGKFVADSGGEFWLDGQHVYDIKKHMGKKVEITGMLRENNDRGSFGTFYFGPSIEVYRYEWLRGTQEMK